MCQVRKGGTEPPSPIIVLFKATRGFRGDPGPTWLPADTGTETGITSGGAAGSEGLPLVPVCAVPATPSEVL